MPSNVPLWAVGVGVGVGTIALVRYLVSVDLPIRHGQVAREDVKGRFEELDKGFRQENGNGIEQPCRAPELVNKYYDLVTDMYEWGWGQSFHFSPQAPHRSYKESNRCHERDMADRLKLQLGMKALDVGCGVGGPMREIARHSGADVTGITISEYQVQRCQHHNQAAGLAGVAGAKPCCTVVRGDFMAMPFEDDSFDAVYAMDATCHAPSIRAVYAECFRVLKPGCLFGTYEWVTTHKFDKSNPAHVAIIDGINYGNALPNLRSYQQCMDAAKEVGFEVLESRDLALPPALPWYDKLRLGKWRSWLTHALVAVLTFLRIAPQGMREVHGMLLHTAADLVAGGETGIFTPMHLILCRKPAGAGAPGRASKKVQGA
eukprot:jgi/Mesvir1/2132/Mv16655-RA.1